MRGNIQFIWFLLSVSVFLSVASLMRLFLWSGFVFLICFLTLLWNSRCVEREIMQNGELMELDRNLFKIYQILDKYHFVFGFFLFWVA